MARYKNGQIPSNLLVEVGPYHWLTAATAARWRALVADVKKNEGVTLRITPGKNAYRDRPGQEVARTNACARGRCNDAALPGTSSHGGEYQGRDSMAIDVDNWALLGKAKWYAYCRKHDFEPGFFDWEPWHIIDWSPYTMPRPSGGGSASPSTPATPESEEDDDMYIANVKNGNFYLVIGKQAHALGSNSGARQSGIPIINYPDDWAVKQLKAGGVTGIA